MRVSGAAGTVAGPGNPQAACEQMRHRGGGCDSLADQASGFVDPDGMSLEAYLRMAANAICKMCGGLKGDTPAVGRTGVLSSFPALWGNTL